MYEFVKTRKNATAIHFEMRLNRSLRSKNAPKVKATNQKNGDNKKRSALDKMKNMSKNKVLLATDKHSQEDSCIFV